MTVKFWDRYSSESLAIGKGETDPLGRLFMSSLGQVNLKGAQFLHEGVDTIRQLYSGIIKPEIYEHLTYAYDLPMTGNRRLITLLGREWLFGSGGKSGYQYRLQDNDLGLIIFIKSRYALETTQYSHLKIELSPHFIDGRDPKSIQGYMNTLASRLLFTPQPVGVSVHLCVDVQGWQPRKGLADDLITHSRRRVDHRGISSAEFDLSELATVYGASQSFLFGSASGLQFSLYRKDLQAKAVDKVHFWESVWNRRTDEDFKSLYDPSQPVWRFEFRYHHSVINEFSRDQGESLQTFSDLIPHLTNLFQYGLRSFRLNAVSSASSGKSSCYRGVYIDAFWQLLMQDIHILAPKSSFFPKRARKKPGMGGMKNLANAVGNSLSIYARNGLNTVQAIKCLMQSGLWQDYVEYHRIKINQVVSDEFIMKIINKKVDEGLRVRRLQGAFA